MDETLREHLIVAQRNEITEYHVYRRLASQSRSGHNRAILAQIGEDEKRHYEFWAERTGVRPPPYPVKARLLPLLARVLGLTFIVKLMEKGEESAQDAYETIAEAIPEARQVIQDENRHERELASTIDEERLQYVGSMVLGLSDALVELTGALAGLTLALGDARLIAMTGLITGIAAAMSMAVSEYLSTKAEDDHRHPLKASLYTGVAYLGTVFVLILPFLLIPTPLLALPVTMLLAVGIIALFTFYVSIAQDLRFWHRFGEMAGLSLGVAVVSFGIGFLVRVVFGVEA